MVHPLNFVNGCRWATARSGVHQKAELFLERPVEVVKGFLEGGNPVVFQFLHDPAEVDPCTLKPSQDRFRSRQVVFDGQSGLQVIEDGVVGLWWNGIDGVGADERFNILEIAVGRVFCPGAPPAVTG